MKSSHTISLFAEGSDLRQRPTSFVASTFVHGFAIAIVWFTVAYTPRIARVETHHYTVRELNLIMPDEQLRSDKSKIAYPGPPSASHSPSTASNASPQPPALREVAQAKPGPQTLIQADVPKPITLTEEIPIPQVMIWSPSKVQLKTIVPPAPQKPTAADTKPTVDRPNQELTVADVAISSTFTPSPKSIITPSTTTPVAIHQPQQVQAPPVTACAANCTALPSAAVGFALPTPAC